MSVDPETVADRIEEIAGRIILPRYGRLSAEDIKRKDGPNDLVTQADELAEAALEKALGDLVPDAVFIGEEKAARVPSLLSAITDARRLWIVDPLDGTRNFVRGVPQFATIVALVEDGAVRMGWIYGIPDGARVIAVEGQGARWNGEPIRPRPGGGQRLTGQRSLGWLAPEEQQRLRDNLATNFETESGHCSAYAYMDLAAGRIDFKVSSRIHPWDHLVGALLLKELGGRVAFLDTGRPLTPMPSVDRALLATAPGRDAGAIAAALRG